MKKAGVLAASVAAASSAALASGSNRRAADHPSSTPNEGSRGSGKETRSRRGEEEKFAPRFDGLRFIETLVTAHR